MDRRLKTSLLPALLLLTLAPLAHAQSLEARIAPHLATETLKNAAVGISIVEITPKGPVELYAKSANLPLGPASNVKLLTTAAAFEKYGPKAAFKTVLYKVGDAGGGDLLLVGGGDPALGDAKLLKEGESVTLPFEKMAAAAKAAGVTSFNNLLIDDRVFDDQFVNPNWPDDQWGKWYCAPVGGLNFNANCLDWLPVVTSKGVGVQLIPPTTAVTVTNKARRGSKTEVNLGRSKNSNAFTLTGTIASSATTPFSTPIYDPGLWTGTILRDVLTSSGISSTGTVKRADLPATATQIAVIETPILSVIQRANTNSVNMMSEALCKRLGHDATGKPGDWANGPAAVEAYVQSLGIDKSLLSLDDGSGLSKKNRVSARAFTTVLAHVAASKNGELFIDTLAVPGEDGTLERRFKKLPVAEHVRAKTGHIAGVSALSGYIDVPQGNNRIRRFAFSILCNKYVGNANPIQDQICQEIYEWASAK